MKRVFLVHGWGGNPQGGWFPWIKTELEQRGAQVIIPVMPNPGRPEVSVWVKYLASMVSPDRDCYLVGHSLGCITILRYMETLKEHQEIGGAVLVAGFSDNLGFRELKPFFAEPIYWKKIKSHCRKFIALNSDNDRYVPLKHGEALKENLGAKLVIGKEMGHFEQKESPLILQNVLDMVK